MRLLILLFLVGVAYASSAYIEVPAVTESGSGAFVNISLRMQPGDGNIYVSVYPVAGEQFQRSIAASLRSVVSREKMDNNDFLVESDASNVTTLLDGPSAGAALGILARSLCEEKEIRHDITITGGLDEHGNIISVGALTEKAEVASTFGKKAILVPSPSLDEKVSLDKLRSMDSIAVVEYDNFDFAYDTFTNPKTELETSITYPEVTFSFEESNLTSINGNRDFESPVRFMIDELDLKVKSIKDDFPRAYSYFKRKAMLARELYEKGYTYSAGNEAFLSLYRVALLSSNISHDQINKSLKRLRECLNRTRKNLENYSGPPEFFANAELRYYWAEREVAGFNKPLSRSQTIDYILSLERANLWCMLAENISARRDGGSVNISALRSLDEVLLSNYANNTTKELFEAADAYNKGYYGASLMSISFHESSTNYTYDHLISNYIPKREWTRMMLAHSRYLNVNKEYGREASKDIARFAMFTDMHMDEVEGRGWYYNTSESWKEASVGDNVEKADVTADGIRNSFELILLILVPICIALVLIYL